MTRLLALLVAVLLGSVPVALAQPAPRPAPVMPSPVPARVELGLVVVHASNEAPRVDPQLASWGAQLQRMPFRSFRQVAEHRFRLTDGASEQVSLPGNHVLTLTLASHDLREARVAIASRRPGGEPVETVITVRRNRAFVYVLKTGRPEQALLLKVAVKY